MAIFPTSGESSNSCEISHFPVSKQTVNVQFSTDVLGKINFFFLVAQYTILVVSYERKNIIFYEKIWNLRKFILLIMFFVIARKNSIAKNIFKSIIFRKFKIFFIKKIIWSLKIVQLPYSLNLNQSNFHWLNQWFAFSLIHQWKQYFPLLYQLIFTD